MMTGPSDRCKRVFTCVAAEVAPRPNLPKNNDTVATTTLREWSNVMKTNCAALIATLAFALSVGTAQSQDAKLGEILGKQAVKLAKEDVEKLVVGANVYNRGLQSERWWDNTPEGKVKGARGAGSFQHNRSFTGEGTWLVNDQGQYCVDLLWGSSKTPEKWCRFLFKVGDDYYGASSAENPDAAAFALKFKK